MARLKMVLWGEKEHSLVEYVGQKKNIDLYKGKEYVIKSDTKY